MDVGPTILRDSGTHRHLASREPQMVRMGNRPRPLNTLVHVFHRIQQTRIHRNGTHVVDRQLYQHDEMEKQ